MLAFRPPTNQSALKKLRESPKNDEVRDRRGKGHCVTKGCSERPSCKRQRYETDYEEPPSQTGRPH